MSVSTFSSTTRAPASSHSCSPAVAAATAAARRTMATSRSSLPLRLMIGATALLPFETVARITLALAAVFFIFPAFESARLWSLGAVLVVQLLARLRRNHLQHAQEPEKID